MDTNKIFEFCKESNASNTTFRVVEEWRDYAEDPFEGCIDIFTTRLKDETFDDYYTYGFIIVHDDDDDEFDEVAEVDKHVEIHVVNSKVCSEEGFHPNMTEPVAVISMNDADFENKFKSALVDFADAVDKQITAFFEEQEKLFDVKKQQIMQFLNDPTTNINDLDNILFYIREESHYEPTDEE